jgi:hypothetical protein
MEIETLTFKAVSSPSIQKRQIDNRTTSKQMNGVIPVVVRNGCRGAGAVEGAEALFQASETLYKKEK